MTNPPIWRLRADHYLNVANTFYIKREIDGETQEMVEHKYPVPRLLQLEDPRARNSGEAILVSTDPQAKLVNSRIWIFSGEPTPDMEPQNEEAEAISAVHRPKWLKPFEELSATGGGQNFAKDLESALGRILDRASAGQATSVGSTSPDALAALEAQMKALMEQNADLAAKVAALAPAPAARRA